MVQKREGPRFRNNLAQVLQPSRAILGATIRHYLAFDAEEKSEIVEILKDSLYVDDLVSGARIDEEGFELYKTKELMSTGGFNL